MREINILKLLYSKSPMNFYQFEDGKTIIKSVNNTSLGYKFDYEFKEADLTKVWGFIHQQKTLSTIFIFLMFIACMYILVFPNYSKLIEVSLLFAMIVVLFVILVIYLSTTFISTKIFESRLKKTFGDFKWVKFADSKGFDNNYYRVFKNELLKVGVLLGLMSVALMIFSPLSRTHQAIMEAQYKKGIDIATVGTKIFPIFSDWYSLRGYARFQLGDYENAILDYDKAYQLGSDIYKTMNFDNKIYIKYYLEDYDGALADFDKEIKNADNDYDKDSFLWDKAQFLYNIKQYEEALVLYTELLNKADNDSIFLLKDRLYLDRAQIYQTMGNLDKAQEDIINAGSVEVSLDEPLDYIPKPVLLLKEL